MARRVVLGTVGRAHGLAGDVYVWLDTDLADTFAPGLVCHIDDRRLTLTHARRHRGRPLARFAGVDSREAAEALRGVTLEVMRDDIVAGEVRVWADELLGRHVVDTAGRDVGVVEGLLDGTAHDFLVVVGAEGRHVLIPVVDALVDLADPVVVHGPPGLLDPDEALG